MAGAWRLCPAESARVAHGERLGEPRRRRLPGRLGAASRQLSLRRRQKANRTNPRGRPAARRVSRITALTRLAATR